MLTPLGVEAEDVFEPQALHGQRRNFCRAISWLQKCRGCEPRWFWSRYLHWRDAVGLCCCRRILQLK
jgi:hypothetical protein